MSLVPEYIYNDRPKHFKGKNDTLGIGLTYEDMPENPNGWSLTDKKIYFSDVRTVDLTGLPTQAGDEELDIELFTFLNNLVLHFQAKYENGIWGRMCFYYRDQVLPNYDFGWEPMRTSPNFFGRFGNLANCKFYTSTYYFRPEPNVTPAFGVYFDIMIPGEREIHVTSTELALAKADLKQVYGSNSAWYATDIMWAKSDTEIPGAPDHYRVSIGAWSGPGSNPGVSFYLTNLENFNTYMKTAGDGTGGKNIYDDDDDPAGTDDPSGPGGGGGNYDNTSDPIDFPDLPTGGALECGAVVAHRVSKQTIEAIMAKLWSYDVSSLWQKAIEEPMDAIVSLHCLPFSPDVVADPNNIFVGSINTEVTAPKVTSQYKVIDCGTLNIKEYWGSALDYSPYTRAEIYLPFVGVKDLAIEDVMNSTLQIKYNVDVLTGDCIAFVKCGMSVLYHFSGNCKMGVPLSSKSSNAFPNYMAGVGGIVSAAGAVATGGSSLLIAGATISAASAVAGSKVRTGRGSELTGANSLMDDFIPYIILHRPVQSLAKNYNKFKGYPSNITATLGSLSGYTEVEHVHIKNIPNATDSELEEIKSLLKEGVLL